MTRDTSSAQSSSTRLSRRAIVATSAKLAYAAPLVAASLQFSALGAGALDQTCTGFPLDPNLTWVFDPNVVPPGAPDSLPGFPGCCSCGPIPGATYYPTANFCCPAGFTPNPAVPLTCVDSSGVGTAFLQPLACVPITQTGVSSPG
jgi:hypothetical protein